jgi:hypothetical protein
MDPGLTLLLQTIQNEQRELRNEMKTEFKEVREEVKELQGFRWKVAGIATATSFIIGIILKVMFH